MTHDPPTGRSRALFEDYLSRGCSRNPPDSTTQMYESILTLPEPERGKEARPVHDRSGCAIDCEIMSTRETNSSERHPENPVEGGVLASPATHPPTEDQSPSRRGAPAGGQGATGDNRRGKRSKRSRDNRAEDHSEGGTRPTVRTEEDLSGYSGRPQSELAQGQGQERRFQGRLHPRRSPSSRQPRSRAMSPRTRSSWARPSIRPAGWSWWSRWRHLRRARQLQPGGGRAHPQGCLLAVAPPIAHGPRLPRTSSGDGGLAIRRPHRRGRRPSMHTRADAEFSRPRSEERGTQLHTGRLLLEAAVRGGESVCSQAVARQ